MIDVLVPVLGRPQNAQRLVDSFLSFSSPLDEITFIASASDSEQVAACEATGQRVLIADWEPGRADYARKMNLGYEKTERDFIFLASDDIDFTKGWSEHALTKATAYSVVATNDMANSAVKRGQFGTHCLVRRSYVDRQGATADGIPGVLMHEGYDHNFVDRELCGVAQSRGEYAAAKHSVVKHRHPLWRTAPDDPTYVKALKHFREDQRLFYKRAPMWGCAGLKPFEMRFVSQKRYTRAR